ncbi:MAG: alpha amylase N-terminal ig-like domain-containing protein [Clostridia bacterium]|nr:alpha amylase N-terminal ig-like domain-containing protein [Clostridia bacterium]
MIDKLRNLSSKTLCFILAGVVALAGAFGAGGIILLSSNGDGKTTAVTPMGLTDADFAKNSTALIEEVFHDQGHIYMQPIEPTTKDEVVMRIRTTRNNVTNAQIQYTADEGVTWGNIEMKHDGVDGTGYYDYWVGTVPAQDKAYYYRFIVGNEISTAYVSLEGTKAQEPSVTSGFYVMPGLETPDWAKGALYYNVLPTVFYNGDTTNDFGASNERTEVSWNEDSEALLWYGGDFEGLVQKLDYIASFGVDGVFMNPMWKNEGNVGYSPADLNQIDGNRGNEEAHKQMIKACHDKDLKVILDAVLQQVSLDNPIFNKSGASPLDGWYQDPNHFAKDIIRWYSWPDVYKTEWSTITFDHSKKATQELLYATENSYLQRYIKKNDVYSADGWRMDVGGYWYGSSDTSMQVMKRIYDYLKAGNKDALMVTENYRMDFLKSYAADGSWHMEDLEMSTMKEWIEGQAEGDALVRALHTYVLQLARPTALCSWLITESHDHSRLYGYTAESKEAVLASIFLTHNYVGSSWIYHGAEYGQKAGSIRWNTMNWDESTWDYDFYQIQRALGTVHNEYSAVRTGVVKDLLVSNKDDLYAFGRWDENGTVVTVTNRNSTVKTAELKVRECDVKDGTILTDYLTGEEYTVKDGKITVNVMPGGTMLVSGKAGNYRGKFELSNANKSILRVGTDSYYLEGEGKLGKKSDKITFAGTPVYNNSQISTQLHKESNGNVYLAMRNSLEKDAAYYGVEVDETGKVTLCVRSENGKAVERTEIGTMNMGDSIKLVREANTFKVYTATGNSDSWKVLEKSATKLVLEEKLYAGFAILDGYAQLEKLSTANLDMTMYDTFEGEVPSMNFIAVGELKSEIKNGVMSIDGNGKTVALTSRTPVKNSVTVLGTVQSAGLLLENGVMADGANSQSGAVSSKNIAVANWTAKAVISGGLKLKNDEFAAVSTFASTEDYVSVGRTVIGGVNYLYFGKTDGGKTLILHKVKDKSPDKPVTVQIQKISSRYTAVYSYDNNTWNNLYTQDLFCSYSTETAALITNAKSAVSFDSFSFGDCINGNSYFTPVLVGTYTPEYETVSNNYTKADLELGAGKLEYDIGGLKVTDKKGTTRVDYISNTYSSFKLDATLLVDSGKGWVGYSFGQTEVGSMDGYVLRLNTNKKLELLKGGKVLTSVKVSDEDYKYGRVTLVTSENSIVAYMGENAKVVLEYSITKPANGYVSYVSNGCISHINNYNIGSLDAEWIVSSYTMVTNNATGLVINSNSKTTSMAYVAGVAATDYIMTARIEKSNNTMDVGVMCDITNKNNELETIKVNYKGDVISVLKGEEVLASKTLPGMPDHANLLIVMQNSKLKIFVDGTSNLLYEADCGFKLGSVPIFYTLGGTGTVSNFKIAGLKADENYKNTAIYKSQIGIVNISGIRSSAYKQDFKSASALDDLQIAEGKWQIKDGALYVNYVQEHRGEAATLNVGKFENFEMSFSAKISSETNFIGVLFRQPAKGQNHEKGGYGMFIDASGRVFLYPGMDEKVKGDGLIPGFEHDKWINYKLVVKGSKIQVYAQNKLIREVVDERLTMGYISLMTMQANGAFDNITITPTR